MGHGGFYVNIIAHPNLKVKYKFNISISRYRPSSGCVQHGTGNALPDGLNLCRCVKIPQDIYYILYILSYV